MHRPLLITAATAAALFAPTLAIATTATLTPSKDNTLIQDATGSVSNGQGTLFVGNTGAFSGVNAHRTVLSFDVASSLPAGATITSVTLSLHVNKTVAGSPETAQIHRLVANWGEGTSNTTTGAGAPSTPGDATWLHTFYPDSLWSTPGGDFAATTSGSTSLGGVGTYTFPSTPQLVADVQGWLNSPSSNFGWVILGDETTLQTVRAIDSRESLTPSFRPTLGITYTSTPPRLPGDVNGDGFVNSADINPFIYALSNDAAGFAAQYPTGVYLNADVNGTNHVGDGFVNAADINPFIAIESGTGEPALDLSSLTSVPEPASLTLLALSPLPLFARRQRR